MASVIALNAPNQLCDRVVKSFGGMKNIMPFLTPKEFLNLQCVSKWFYNIATERAQISIRLPLWMPRHLIALDNRKYSVIDLQPEP